MFVPTSWGFEETTVLPGCVSKKILIREQYRSPLSQSSSSCVFMVSPEGLLWFESGLKKETMSGIWLDGGASIQVPNGWWFRFAAIRDTIVYETSASQTENPKPTEDGARLSPDEFREILSAYIKDNCKTRILEIDEAATVALAVRASKRKLGFCNGCFDLMHLGHLEMLLQAKLRCDVLFVAVNSDQSIKQLKGALRPFIDETARMNMVASVRYVDYVIRNPEATCVESVKAVSPDIYVKTREHGDSGPEAQAVKAMGGVVDVVEMIPGYSTSIIANQITKSIVIGC